MKGKITACLVIFNEEAVIERCLKSLLGVVDEIVIAHDGECSDSSIEICKKYTDKIVVVPHHGIAERHRPLTYSMANGEWILQLDADEYLSEELRKGIRDLVRKDEFDAYGLFWPFWDGKRYITKRCFHKVALFRKEKIEFVGVSQASVELDTKRVYNTELLLEHRPTYNNFTLSRFRAKWLKWAKIQASEYLKPITDIPQFQTNRTEWPNGIKRRLAYPLLYVPIDFAYNFLGQLKGGLWRE